jgi:uncharacterized Zn-finger protein
MAIEPAPGKSMPSFETVIVDADKVACAGEGGPVDGHPRVFLNLGPDGRVECPYCSRLFVKRGAPAASTPRPAARR